MISVIIPTFKQNGLLNRAIDSVIEQTYKDYEIIVVDDNNPDTPARISTEMVMSKYATNHQVKYIRHERNKNGAVARNTGIRASKGDYIAFLDDDDAFLPNKIGIQVEYLSMHPEYDAVYSGISIDGIPIRCKAYEGNALIPLLTERTRMYTSTLMFRRQCIFDIKGFDESFRRHQDFEILIKFFNSGFKIGYIPMVLANYNNVGNNRLKGLELEKLKAQYLSTFSDVINRLDVEKRGLKRKIIVNNYASVFVSYLSMHEYRLAYNVFMRYFFKSPFDFISYILFFSRLHFGIF